MGERINSKNQMNRAPTVFRVNKESAHAEFIVHEDRAEAAKPPFWFHYDRSSKKVREGFSDGDALKAAAAAGYVPEDQVSVGCCRKWVDVPAQRLSQRVVLRIGGVEAGVGVYVNGRKVGYSQDSMTPAEFNVTPYLKPGNNPFALKVFRWTDGRYLEIQDRVRANGIRRDYGPLPAEGESKEKKEAV